MGRAATFEATVERDEWKLFIKRQPLPCDKTEIEALCCCRGPSLARIAYWHNDADWHWIAMEHAGPHNLARVVGGNVDVSRRVAGWFRQLVNAAFSMHSHGWVHRDIKMDNIVLDIRQPERITLVDLGSACRVDATPTTPTTPEYARPPVLSAMLTKKPYPPARPTDDTWAIGVTLVELCDPHGPMWRAEEWTDLLHLMTRDIDTVCQGAGPRWAPVAKMMFSDKRWTRRTLRKALHSHGVALSE